MDSGGKAPMKFWLYLKLQGYFGYENDCTHVILIKVVFMVLKRRSIQQLAYSIAIPEESAENKYLGHRMLFTLKIQHSHRRKPLITKIIRKLDVSERHECPRREY
jgi:hypothetical protein